MTQMKINEGNNFSNNTFSSQLREMERDPNW